MIRKANNVYSVLLNDASVVSTALPAEGTVVTDANLPKGAIVLCDLGLRRLSAAAYTALANNGQYIVVQGKGVGVPLMKSPVITKGTASFSIAKFKSAVQQVTFVGYNLTSGALPTANNSDFWIKLRKRDNDAANRSQPMSLFAGPVKTDATGTQRELAFSLLKAGTKNFVNEPTPNHYLKFEVVCAGTQADWTGTATHISVTNGSKAVIFTDGSGAAASGQALAAGTLIRIAGVAYEIPVVGTTAGFTLGTAFTGTTAEVAGGTSITANAGVVATPGDFGIKITGTENPFDVNRFRDYYANRFTVTFSDTTTLITNSVGAYNGNGVWQQVAMDEYMSYGFEGQNDILGTPPRYRDQEVKIPGMGSNTALTSKYSALNIAWEEDIKGLVVNAGGKGNVLVYLNLTDSSGSGVLPTSTDNNGETFVVALGLTASAFNE
jgi:hypothetical protein